jgi:hypothetical protein
LRIDRAWPIKLTINITTKTKVSNLATDAKSDASPPNPKIDATTARMKKAIT